MPKNLASRIIKISKRYDDRERLAIAADILEYIKDRASSAKVPGKKKYSDAYAESLDFAIAGKDQNKVTMELSGDMLTDLELVSHDDGELEIGYSPSNPSHGKAEGNITGSYGRPKGSRKNARPFLNLTRDEVKTILAGFPLDDDKKRGQAVQAREDAIDTLFLEEDEE